MNKPYRIETDASDFGCGAVLLQPGDDESAPWHPVAYESKKFSSAERNIPVGTMVVVKAKRNLTLVVE